MCAALHAPFEVRPHIHGQQKTCACAWEKRPGRCYSGLLSELYDDDVLVYLFVRVV